MQLERLRLFAELVNNGSYTKTADHLKISKAYLSKQIKALEVDLKTQLIIRNTRTMRLTAAGQTLFQQASKLTTFWQDSKELLSVEEESLAGLVRFTAPTGLLKYELMPEIRKLANEYPEINLTGESGNQTHNLISTPYDFAVRITNTPPQDVVAKKLGEIEYICCASPDYLEIKGTPKFPDELATHDCVALSYWTRWLFKVQDVNRDVAVDAKYQFSDNEVVKQAAIDGLGVCRLPSYILKPSLINGELVPLFPEITPEKKSVYLLFPQSLKRAERVNLVMHRFSEVLTKALC